MATGMLLERVNARSTRSFQSAALAGRARLFDPFPLFRPVPTLRNVCTSDRGAGGRGGGRFTREGATKAELGGATHRVVQRFPSAVSEKFVLILARTGGPLQALRPRRPRRPASTEGGPPGRLLAPRPPVLRALRGPPVRAFWETNFWDVTLAIASKD